MWIPKRGASSRIHVPLTTETWSLWCKCLFVFINCNTCLSAYWKTVCFVRASSAQSIRSNALTCKELLHVADSKRSSALFIDPVGDLLHYGATVCYYFIEIKHFHLVEVNFQWTTHTYSFQDSQPRSHWLHYSNRNKYIEFLGTIFSCRFDALVSILGTRMVYVGVTQNKLHCHELRCPCWA